MSSDPFLDTHQHLRQQLKRHPSQGTFSSAEIDGSGGGGEQDDDESFSAHQTRRFGGNYRHDEDDMVDHQYLSSLAYNNAAEATEIRDGGRGKFSTTVPHDSLWFENSPSNNQEDDEGLNGKAKDGGIGGRSSQLSSTAFATPQSSSPHSLRQSQIGDSRRIPEAPAGDDLKDTTEATSGLSGRGVREGGGVEGDTPQTPLEYTSSESDDDRAQFEYRQFSSGLDPNGQRSTTISSFPGIGGRPRRDSGLPPIQLTAAKRLPHYPPQASANSAMSNLAATSATNKSSSASSLVSTPMAIEEEEEEEEEDDVELQQQRLRRQLQQQFSNEHLHRQLSTRQLSQSEEMDSEDIVESLEIREREMPPIQQRVPNPQSIGPAQRTTSNNSAAAVKKPPVVYTEPPDRGPADLSNPSLALAEALIAARAQAESRKNAATAANAKGSSIGNAAGAASVGSGIGATGGGVGGAAVGTNNSGATATREQPSSAEALQKQSIPTSKDRVLQQQQQQQQLSNSTRTASVLGSAGAQSPSNTSPQVRIPVPHLSPMLRGQPISWDHHHPHSHQQHASGNERHMDPAAHLGAASGRSPESIPMARRTSFTLSPTSSNPELGHSQTDSHSGDSLMAAHLVGRAHGQDYRHQDSQLGSSYDSNRYNRDGAQHQPRRRDSPSYSSASSPPTHLHRLHPSHHHEDHTRFLFPGRDTDQQSIGEEDIEEEMPHYDHPARHHNSQQKHHHHFRDSSHHSRYESSINDDMDDPFRPRHRPSVPHHHHHHHHHRASASEASAYPLSTSSRSIEESHDEHAPGLRRHHEHRHHQGETEDEEMDHDDHDDDDATTSSAAAARMADDEQLRAETEYIMSRNAELLKILAIRDDEIQTLQQELDHTLKIMHEYENDLMEMHTAAAQPYESYHQTLDEIGREMTQQDALLKGYKEENEKLASQCRSLVKIRNETEKRHLEKVETLQTEIERLQKLLDEARQKLQQYQRSQPSPSPNEGSVSQADNVDNSQDRPETHDDLRAALTRLEALRERERVSYLNKEEGYLAEIAMLKDRVAMLEKILEDEKRHKVEDIQRLERDFQDVRDGYDDMVEQIKSLGVSSVPLPPTTGKVPTKTATYTVSERPLLLHRESSSDETSSMTSGKHNGRKVGGSTTPISGIHSRGSASSSSLHQKTSPDETTTATAKPSSARSQRGPDRKLTSTETLTTSNMPKVMAELGLDQRISRFEADIRQSLMRSSSMDSFASVQSSSNNSNGAAATATMGITSMAPTTATTAVSSSGHPLGSTTVGTTGSTVSTAPTSTGPSTTSTSSSSLAAVSHQASGEQLRPTSVAESQALANKLRDRINVLNAENQRLHQELATLSQAMRQQQAERQRKVKQLEDLLDLHESVAEKKLMEDRTMAAAAPTTPTTTSDPNTGSQGGEEKSKKDPSSDPSTVEGQQRIRKIIQGLLVRIRTKEAEAEFYHNAYLDKVLELDQLALKTSNKGLFFSPLQGPLTPSAATAAAGDPMAAGAGTPVSPLPPSSADQTALAQQQQQQQQQQIQLQQQQQTIAALENRVMELEQANLELTIRLQVEQRRAQARESENTALTREKLVLARLLEDQIEELKAKLANTEVAHQKLLEENATLRERGAKDAAAAAAAAKAAAATKPKNDAQDEELAILRSRMSSLTRQRDQLREQLQEALDIQLKMTHDSGVAGAGSGPGAAVLKSGTGASSAAGAAGTRNEWTVEDYKRLERALEEKTTELCLWKERAIALEKVVERIRMIKVKPDVFGSASTTSSISDAGVHGEQRRGERTSGHESESSASVASASSSASNIDHSRKRRSQGGGSSSKHGLSRSQHQRPPLSHTLEELDQIVLKLEQRLERRDQELREVVLEAKRQTDMRLEQWKAKWVQVVQRKNAEIRRFQIELESLMKAVDRDRQRMMARQQQKDGANSSNDNHALGNGGAGSATGPGVVGGSKLRSGSGLGPGMHLSSHQDDYDDEHDLVV